MKKVCCCWLLLFIFFQFNPFICYAQKDVTSDEKAYMEQVRGVMSEEPAENGAKLSSSLPKNRNSSVSFSYFRLIFSLLLVCGIIYLVYFFLRKKLTSTVENKVDSSILSVLPLGNAKNVQVIFIAGKFLIIGVTANSIHCLGEVTDKKEIDNLMQLQQERKIKSGESFGSIFQGIIKKSGFTKAENKDFDYEKDSLLFLKQQTEKLSRLNDEDVPKNE